MQLLVGMWEVRRNNVFGVVAFGSYGGFWLSLAGYEVLAVRAEGGGKRGSLF